MPNQPATPVRTVRISDDLWDLTQRVARTRNEYASDVVRRALERYLRDYGWVPEDDEA